MTPPRFLLPAFLLCAASAFAGDWYVATDGNDAWSGKLPAPNADHSDGPFATLTKARDAVRADTGTRKVYLREGLYMLPQGLAFGAQHAEPLLAASQSVPPEGTNSPKLRIMSVRSDT